MKQQIQTAIPLINQLKTDSLFPDIYTNVASIYSNSSEIKEMQWQSNSPIAGQILAQFNTASDSTIKQCINQAHSAFLQFRNIPAPLRGQLVRHIGILAREQKQQLAELISLESGKIYQEALGEVQEMIDVCDFAVGLSRQLHGLTISSERPNHRMMEQWHPLGVISIISAFNFPMAVWAWNAMLALVCGNTIIWKPSTQTPLSALACQQLLNQALGKVSELREIFASLPLSTTIQGHHQISQQLVKDNQIALVSATGSCKMGTKIYQSVAARLGRCLLELGGNNAMIVTANANLSLALRAIVFSAVGTTGQRCTSLRRLIVHQSIKTELIKQLVNAYKSLTIGDPMDKKILLGPIINAHSFQQMQTALEIIVSQGGKLIYGGERISNNNPESIFNQGYYVSPALLEAPADLPIMQEETFAPLLYIIEYQSLAEAIEIQNNVRQGLSSAIFTENMHEAELFLSASGSDCGIANVNIGTSGAEIGGAFGGEKETGGGRESGSDAWKNYMRRCTNTINYGVELPLAQGINFTA
ncbi:MAG: aldehyde dehydrogenase family protein [Pseudomonadota bacterium]